MIGRARAAADVLRDRVDGWWHRRDAGDEDLVNEDASRSISAEDRASLPFDRESVLRACGHTAAIEGRSYPYVLLPGTGRTLCIHYSAFFGEWGDRRQTRAQFKGWFHRLRMFWPLAEHNFLFLCDTYGADSNGTYYKGENGDFFVERAMGSIQDDVAASLGLGPTETVTIGSSMGATAALRFALRHGYAGAVAVSPHIDLDISALRQGRLRHVAAVVGRDDVDAPELRPVTREIAELVATTRPLPRLVAQSMLDDDGVHKEQVLPMLEAWKQGGGEVLEDFHPHGGHTSDYASVDFFSSSIRWCLGLA
jgi:pimeloyl-ACP methyl ester carboxylesterase